MGTDPQNGWSRLALGLIVLFAGCGSQPDAACLIGLSEGGPYLVQLRPQGPFPSQCPQGTQYQMVLAQRYAAYASESPATIVFFLEGSSEATPPAAAEASGEFTSFRIAPRSDVCTIPRMTPALDDSATPVDAPTPVGPTTYTFSEVRVLSDAAHRGNQFEARAVVDYGISGCSSLEYVAQGVWPMTQCLNDSICLPDPVGTEVAWPAGRGLGSGLNRDYRAFCNLDPALLDNPEMTSLSGAGREAYPDDQGNLHDLGICFLSEPFPSLCPAGSSLSTTGPCVVGPGSNPH